MQDPCSMAKARFALTNGFCPAPEHTWNDLGTGPHGTMRVAPCQRKRILRSDQVGVIYEIGAAAACNEISQTCPENGPRVLAEP